MLPCSGRRLSGSGAFFDKYMSKYNWFNSGIGVLNCSVDRSGGSGAFGTEPLGTGDETVEAPLARPTTGIEGEGAGVTVEEVEDLREVAALV